MKIVIELDDDTWVKVLEGYVPLGIGKQLKNGIPIDKFLEDIKADIESYEADCILAEDSKECKECDKIVFGSIYNIIDKHIGKEHE